MSLLADLVTVICFAAPRAHFEISVNTATLTACLVLTFLALIERCELAAMSCRAADCILSDCSAVAEPECIALESINQTLAQGESNLEKSIFSQGLLQKGFLLGLVLRVETGPIDRL